MPRNEELSTLKSLLMEDDNWVNEKPSPDGSDEVCIDCCFPSHVDLDIQMYVNLTKAEYLCVPCEQFGDAFAYLIVVRGLTPKKAAGMLKSKYKWTPKKIEASSKELDNSKNAQQGLPPSHDEIPKSRRGKLALISKHSYQNEKEVELFVVGCYQKTGIENRDKPIHKVTYTKKHNKNEYWECSPTRNLIPEFDRVDKFPLYRLPKFLVDSKGTRTDGSHKQCWLVHDEHTVDRIQNIPLKNPIPVVCIYGKWRSINPEQHDFTPLYGKSLLLIAKQNQQSREFMGGLASHLHSKKCEVKMVLPKGEGEATISSLLSAPNMSEEKISKWIKKIGVTEFKAKETIVKETKQQQNAVQFSLPDNDKFRVLGLENDRVAILIKKSRMVHKIMQSRLNNIGVLLVLADLNWWIDNLGNANPTSPLLNQVASAINRAAEGIGIADVNNATIGRGAFYCKRTDKYIYNLGNKLLIEDKLSMLSVKCSFDAVDELFVAGTELPIIEVDELECKQLCKRLSDLIMTYRWNSPNEARAYIGWIVTSIIGGALSFRPMLLLVAMAGSGKTFLTSEVLKLVMGKYIQHISGTYEAGVADSMKNDSLPVVLDEFEPKDQSQASFAKWQQILALIRQATSGEGKRTRSQATGIVRESIPRFSALAQATKKLVMDEADLQRLFPLSLKSKGLDNVEWIELEQNFKDLMRGDNGIKIVSYIIRNTRKIVDSVNRMEVTFAKVYPDNQTRQNKILAALTVGSGFMSGDSSPIEWVESAHSDRTELLSELLDSLIQLQNGIKRTLAECLRYAYWMDGVFSDSNQLKTQPKTNEFLVSQQYGLRMQSADVLLIAVSHKPMKELLKNSVYANVEIKKVLMDIDGVEQAMVECPKTEHFPNGNRPYKLRFGGVNKSCIKIPKKVLDKIGFEKPREGDPDYRESGYFNEPEYKPYGR